MNTLDNVDKLLNDLGFTSAYKIGKKRGREEESLAEKVYREFDDQSYTDMELAWKHSVPWSAISDALNILIVNDLVREEHVKVDDRIVAKFSKIPMKKASIEGEEATNET